MRKLVSSLASVTMLAIVAGVAGVPSATAQNDKEITRQDRRIDNLIRSIDDIVWSNVIIYRLQDDFKNRLVTSMQAEDSADIEQLESIGEIIAPAPLPNFASNALAIIGSPRGRTVPLFTQAICQRYQEFECEYDFDPELMARAHTIASSIHQSRLSRPKDFFLVTSRDRENPRLIALLGINMETGSPSLMSFRRVGSQLYDYLATNNNDSTMYGELKEAVRLGAGGISNQMFLLRDLSKVQIVEHTKAIATYIDEEEYPWVIRSISLGRPIREEWTPPPTADSGAEGGDDVIDLGALLSGGGSDIFGVEKSQSVVDGAAVKGAVEYPNEIVVGTDVVVGYYSYEMKEKEKQVKETKWGLELLNNFDELNYPSIWGGRLTLNALLRNIKIGAILPQQRFGGNTVAESGLFEKPQKILGGYGIAFGGDFAAPLINNSGLFNFHGSYTFSEASTDALAPTIYTVQPGDSSLGRPDVDGDDVYLIRYAFQGYYSFGFYADNEAEHLFRLKLGGSVYGVDTYERRQVNRVGSDIQDTVPTLEKSADKTVGGVAGKIEYMKGGTDIPYGLGFQYFDGSVLSNVWLQFIVLRNLDVKLEGKFFSPLFRDAQPWEESSLVIPSIELKYHFGTP